jgi:hypothetical protein
MADSHSPLASDPPLISASSLLPDYDPATAPSAAQEDANPTPAESSLPLRQTVTAEQPPHRPLAPLTAPVLRALPPIARSDDAPKQSPDLVPEHVDEPLPADIAIEPALPILPAPIVAEPILHFPAPAPLVIVSSGQSGLPLLAAAPSPFSHLFQHHSSLSRPGRRNHPAICSSGPARCSIACLYQHRAGT